MILLLSQKEFLMAENMEINGLKVKLADVWKSTNMNVAWKY